MPDIFGPVIAAIYVLAALVLILVASCIYTYFTPNADSVRQEAVAAGVAEWKVDQKTGEASFHWKVCK